MAKQEIQPKITLEREYIVPLRSGWLKVPKYKRANKAVKTLKEFIAQHMKVYDKDLNKIKIEKDLNNEIRFRGMKKPLGKIKVSAKKYDNGIVRVDLIEIPVHIKFNRLREEKRKAALETKKKIEKPVEAPASPVSKEKQEESEESKELEQTSKEANLELSKQQAKTQKHTAKDKKVVVHRKALSR